MHTVVYTHGGGRLGNQLLRFMHWLAWALENSGRVEVIDFAFWPFAPYFYPWSDHPGCVYPLRDGKEDFWAKSYQGLPRWIQDAAIRRDRFGRVLVGSAKILAGRPVIVAEDQAGGGLNLEGKEFLDGVRAHRITVVQGWRIAGWNFLRLHSHEIRQLFIPGDEYASAGQIYIRRLREKYQFLIGIFVRQGDYAIWRGGRFYFTAERYRRWMEEIIKLYPDENVGFVVGSDVVQDPAMLRGLPAHFVTGEPHGPGCWFENWVELSKCDLLLSPPSTFSATAAFVGEVPLWPVTSNDQRLSRDQILNDHLFDAAVHPEFSLAVK